MKIKNMTFVSRAGNADEYDVRDEVGLKLLLTKVTLFNFMTSYFINYSV